MATNTAMLRATLLAWLAAGALAIFHGDLIGGSIYSDVLAPPPLGPLSGLSGLLLPAHVGPAVRLVRTRYAGISHAAAVDVIRLVVGRPHVRLLTAVQLQAVPVISQRLSFLQTVVNVLPPVLPVSMYSSGLLSYLHGLGSHVTAADLVDPLALIDARLAVSFVAPTSVASFCSYIGSQILHVHGGRLVSLPPLSTFYSRLVSLRLTPVPVGFRRVTVGVTSSVVSTVQPALHRLGLTRLVQPTTVIGGLVDYLHQQQIPVGQFVQRVTQLNIPHISNVVGGVQLRPALRRLSFLPAPVVRQDIVPLLALRFHTLPSALRAHLRFGDVVSGFLSTLDVSHPVSLNRGFISGLLGSFDSYIYSRAKGFRGTLWSSRIWARK